MKKLLALICLIMALLSASALAADINSETSLWPAYDPETGLWGYIDEQGAWGIAPQWERAYHFHGGCAIVDTKDVPSWQGESTQGIIDENGEYLLAPEYSIDDACCLDGAGLLYLVSRYDEEWQSGWFNIPNRYFSGLNWTECYAEGESAYIKVSQDYALSGLADRATGEIVVPVEYQYGSLGLYDRDVSDGFIVGQRAGTDKHELIEIGVGVVPLPEGVAIRDVYGVTEGLIRFQQDGLYGYLNAAGEIVIPAQFDLAGSFVDGYANVSLLEAPGISHVIDREGQIVLRLSDADDDEQGRYIGVVDGALLVSWSDDSWSLIEPDGTVRCHHPMPEDAYDVWLYEISSDGPIWLKYSLGDDDYLWGLMSREGELLGEPRWTWVSGEAVSEDGAWVGSDFVGTFGYVDEYGEFVLPGVYAWAEPFDGALARVMLDTSTEAYINRSGEVVYSWPAVNDAD